MKKKKETEDAEEKIEVEAIAPIEMENIPRTEAELEEAIKREKQMADLESWKPKTELGRKVKSGKIKDISEILDSGMKILEPEIVDALLPGMEIDLLFIGQSKGKFGGGQKRVFRQTQKKTQEGNKPKFATCAVIGNSNGYIGIGYGKSKETVPAREKSIRDAKYNLIKIKRGCGSWQCNCKQPHSLPFEIEGKAGCVRISFKPAPKGAGLVAEPECAKILKMAGIKDVYSKMTIKSKSKLNVIRACMDAMEKLVTTKTQSKYTKELGIIEGPVKIEE